jgi:probable HAF family extracellular repeat protein
VSYSFVTLDPPGSILTQARGVNAAGQVVGYFEDVGGIHGFLFTGAGFTVLDRPGYIYTAAYGINGNGQVVGYSLLLSGNLGQEHGFLLAGGVYSTIDYPGSALSYATGINGPGQIVGEVGAIASPGYVLSNGRYAALAGLARGINDAGTIVYATVSVPGALLAEAAGINNAGSVVGRYLDTRNVEHGFLLSGGVYTSIDVPGSIQTRAFGINDVGQGVGSYRDTSGVVHPESATLGRELQAFKAKITNAGNETMAADWRLRQHDDLVLALALGAYLEEHRGCREFWIDVR